MVIPKNQRTDSDTPYRGSQKRYQIPFYRNNVHVPVLSLIPLVVMKSANSLVPKLVPKDLNRVAFKKSKYPPNTCALCHHQHGGVELTQG
jgi:hypothetical protein